VTVASFLRRRAQTGDPTISLRPRTTAFFPAISIPVEARRSMTPAGVQGEKRGSEAREERRPML